MQRENSLTDNNIYVLKQGLDLLGQLDDHLYVSVKQPFFKSGVGTHFRHCLDSYDCFLTGVEEGRIDYDLRARDALIETDRAVAIAKTEAIIGGLQTLSITDGRTPLLVKLETAPDQEAASWGDSSLMRELQFLMSHTIHHYAIVAVLLRLQGFDPGQEFGVAPSTLEYWRSASQCAR